MEVEEEVDGELRDVREQLDSPDGSQVGYQDKALAKN